MISGLSTTDQVEEEAVEMLRQLAQVEVVVAMLLHLLLEVEEVMGALLLQHPGWRAMVEHSAVAWAVGRRAYPGSLQVRPLLPRLEHSELQLVACRAPVASHQPILSVVRVDHALPRAY